MLIINYKLVLLFVGLQISTGFSLQCNACGNNVQANRLCTELYSTECNFRHWKNFNRDLLYYHGKFSNTGRNNDGTGDKFDKYVCATLIKIESGGGAETVKVKGCVGDTGAFDVNTCKELNDGGSWVLCACDDDNCNAGNDLSSYSNLRKINYKTSNSANKNHGGSSFAVRTIALIGLLISSFFS